MAHTISHHNGYFKWSTATDSFMLLFTQCETTSLKGPCPSKTFRINIHFCFERLYPKKYCCSPKIKHFGPCKFFGQSEKYFGWLRHWVAVPLLHLSKMSEVNSHMRKSVLTIVNRDLKWTSEHLLPCYCYATKSNSRTTRLQVSWSFESADWVDMSELQAHHCITLERWSWGALALQ